MAVAFDAKSLSGIGTCWWTLENSRTWEHTATGSDLMVVVAALVRRNEPVGPTVAVRYAETALTSAGRVWLNNLPPSQRTHSFIELFTGPVEEAGTYEATVTVSAGTRFTGEYRAAALTYTGVDRAGKLTTAFGAASGTAMNVTATSLTGRRVVAAFAHEAYPAIGSFSATQRDPLDLSLAISEGAVGDTTGAAVVTVTAARQSGKPWCGAALDLVSAGEASDLLAGATPNLEVVAPAPTSTVTIPVLTLAPAFNQMNPKHLRGELFRFPYVPTKIPYMNWPSNSFAAGGVTKLDTYLHRYAGQRILVVGHSMGGQVVQKWLREKGGISDIDPTEVTFIITGNLERKYNGFPDGGDYPGGEGGTGTPEDTPYKVIDIARQYDFWADHPTDTDNTVAMRNVDPDGNGLGIGSPVHGDYSQVSANPDDARNFTLVEGNITYVWSPTYPAPIIDDQDFFKTAKGIAPQDEVLREDIEAGYTRPVTIPDPPPGGKAAGQFPWGWDTDLEQWVRVSPASVEAPSPTTWWIEIEEGS